MEQVQGKQTIKAYLNKDKKETQKCNGKVFVCVCGEGVMNFLVCFLRHKIKRKKEMLHHKYKEEYNGKGAVGEAMIAGPAGLILGPSTFLRQ